ncbi:MAG: HAD-IA family hydrolase [Acidobacteriota bacterium]
MSTDFRLLVFDWDGTLMDSVSAIIACTRGAMVDAGLVPRPEAEIRRAIGMGLFDSFVMFYPGIAAEKYEQVVESYRHHWLATYKDHSTLFSGVRAALDELTAQGYLLAVATAKSRRGLERDLANTGLAGVIRASRTVDEAPPKPHPGMLAGLMGELGVDRDETLMIGDTTYDLDMARNAGTSAVGVLSGSHLETELLASEPLACLSGVAALPEWLAARRPEAIAFEGSRSQA